MKNQENRELKSGTGIFNSKVLICIISAILCIAIVAVICIGTVNGINHLKAENEAAQNEISSLQNSLKRSNEELEAAKGIQSQMGEDINALNTLVDSLKQSLASVDEANKAAQKEIDSLKETTKEEIDFTMEQLKNIVANLRNMSPLYEDFVKKMKH